MDLSQLSDKTIKELSSLDEERSQVAMKVINSARKYGINPEFVLPMVKIESGFKPSVVSEAGAIGPMQLLPKTAKDLKVDPNDVDQNIDGGMRFLKSLIDNKKFESDPEKIFAAYNAGPNHKFFETQNMADLKDETVGHVVKILNEFGKKSPPMTLSSSELEVAPSEPEVTPSEPIKLSGDESPYGSDIVPTWDQNKEEQEARRTVSGALGAAAGTTLGTVYAAKAPVVRMAQRVGLLPGGKPIAPAEAAQLVEKAMTPQSVVRQPAHGGEAWQKGLTGISTPGAQMNKKSLDLAQGMQEAVGIHGVPGFTGGTITEGGLILSPSDVQAIQAKQAAAPIPRVPQPGIISTVASKILGSSPVKGGLVGLNLGYGGQDISNRLANKDYTGAGISGAGLVGDVASLAPTATKLGARVAPLGGALSASADAARRAHDRDYIGALTSAVGAVGPYVAPFALGPEVGIPVGIGLALGSPIANEVKDYIQRKMAGE